MGEEVIFYFSFHLVMPQLSRLLRYCDLSSVELHLSVAHLPRAGGFSGRAQFFIYNIKYI